MNTSVSGPEEQSGPAHVAVAAAAAAAAAAGLSLCVTSVLICSCKIREWWCKINCDDPLKAQFNPSEIDFLLSAYFSST